MTSTPVALVAGVTVAAAVLGLGRALAGGRLPGASRGPGRGPSSPATRPLRVALRRCDAALRAADVGYPVAAVIAWTAVACGAGLVVGAVVMGSLVGAGVGVAAPPAALAVAVKSRAARRPRRVAGQLPGVLRHVADAVRAGQSLRQALTRAGHAAPEPAGTELRRLAVDLEQGARAEDALDGLADRVPHTDVRIAVCAMAVTMRSGGDMARILTDLAGNLEDRRRLAAELAGLTGQARMTAWLVAALPAVGGLAVEVSAPGTLARTLGEGLGRVAALVAAVLMATAFILIRRLARVRL